MALDRVCMISVHSCPLDILGGRETGGMNVCVRELSKKMGQRGIGVDVFTRAKNLSIPKITHLGENVRVVHIKAGLEEHYDKHFVWNHLPEFLDGVLDFVQEEGIAYGLIHSHYWLSGWVAGKLSKQWGAPTVHTSHTLGFLKNQVARTENEKEPSFRLSEEKEILSVADSIIATTPLEKMQIRGEFDLAPDKIKVIPCGVDSQLFKPWEPEASRLHLGLNGEKFILFVGRIDPIKGVDRLIRAMDILTTDEKGNENGLKLFVIGGSLPCQTTAEDTELRNLMRLTSELNLEDRVDFLGAMGQDVLPYYYSSAEVCVLPSRHESFGLVALEAMACGTPVVASEVGGLSYVVAHERTGFLVPEGDPERLAERIRCIVAHPEIREEFGREAAKWVERFDWALIADKVMNLYSELVS